MFEFARVRALEKRDFLRFWSFWDAALLYPAISVAEYTS